MLTLNTSRQEMIITLCVAVPGLVKALPMLVINLLVGRHQEIDLMLYCSFGFNCIMFANHAKDCINWPALRNVYTRSKRHADELLAERGLQRPERVHHNRSLIWNWGKHRPSHSEGGEGGEEHKPRKSLVASNAGNGSPAENIIRSSALALDVHEEPPKQKFVGRRISISFGTDEENEEDGDLGVGV
ncbi:hypothetical protein HK104_001566 [Borealophlyctis nickersoniae]|nr:hypothetical protein HK104_001566 [Borealophlyctis nickersoniae]